MSAPAHISPDPTFYRSPGAAAAAPAEKLAYVAAFDRTAQRPDALTVVDVDPGSPRYGQVVGWADLPTLGDELHHFGWNACSSALAHEGHNVDGLQRRYLLLPGLRSSNVHVYDTHPDPANPTLVKTIGAKELAEKAGYSRPHTLHCGPEGIFLSCLGGGNGADGPGGIALLDTLITSEWGLLSMIEDGVKLELLLDNEYGHALHFWDLAADRHLQRVDLGAEHQMVLELRPAHDPEATWGFVGVVVSTQDLAASVWRWHREGAAGPLALKPFGAVPPLITDIGLSVDDQQLYMSCWGTGDLKQYDVSNPAQPRETGSVRLGGIVGRTAHPAAPDQRLTGGSSSSDSYCYR